MVDQPNHKSYKIRGHTRLRKSSKPYSRPNEPKNKGLLDKVKDYLSPSWLFGYFTSNEDECEPSNFEDDVLDENATVTHEEGGSSSCVPNQERLASLEEENDEDDAFEKDNNTSISDDKVFDANDSKQDRMENADTSIRLSGCLNDDIDDENEKQVLEQTDKPQTLSYSTDQLTRKPLPSLFHYRSASSSLLQQRGTPSLRSQGKSFLGPMSTRGNSYAPGLKFSTPMISSGNNSFCSTIKPTSGQTKLGISLTRSSSLKDNSASAETLSVAAKPRFNALSTSSVGSTRPDSAGDSAPLFSVEKFVTPVQRTFTNKRVGSPSYPGPIMYGGALNVSRDVPFKRRRTSSPGSESYHPVSNLRIRGVKERTIQNRTVGGTGTRTAQRILDALESVSSPLKDVRRIPSPISLASASPLSFMPSRTRTTPPKTKVGPRVSYLQAKLLGDPPVSSLQTPDVAKVSFVEHPAPGEPQPSSPPSSPPSKKTSKQPSQDQAFFSGLKDTVLKSSLPASFAPKSLPTSLSPIENSGKSSGKMRTAPRSAAMHYSSYKNNQDDEVINPLPEIRNAVPLPVNPGKNMSLPMFNTNKKTYENGTTTKLPNKSENIFNKQKESSTNSKLLTESPKNGFIFSTPQPKSQRFSVKESLEAADNEVSFSFSEPAPVKTSSDNVKETFKNPLVQSETTSNCFKATVNHSTKSNDPFSRSLLTNDTVGSGKCKTPPTKASEKSEPAKTIDLAQRFAPAAGSWECTSCLIINKVDAVKCVACEKAKPSAKRTSNTGKDKQEKQELDLKTKFAAPKDKLECDTFLVRNKTELDKCAASETNGPGTGAKDDLKLKFAAPSGSWECPTCMLQNKAADRKCVACSESKPGCVSSDNFKLKFAAPTGSWECPTCLIQNKAVDLKCVACETSKPGTESSGSSQTGFTSNQATSATSGFTFGVGSDASKSSTSSGFTFGNSNSGQSVDTQLTSTFTFGQSSSKTTTKANTSTTANSVSKPTPGFTFGGSSGEKPSTTPAFTFGAGSNKVESKPQFSFGVSNAENTSSQIGGLQKEENNDKAKEKPLTAPTMNIAQAAAAGLLNVPGKESTLSQVNVQAPAPAPTQPLAQAPIQVPTQAPTQGPTQAPTQGPTQAPTQGPTQAPTQGPTQAPTQGPTQAPTQGPTHAPAATKPSAVPTFTFVGGNAASGGPVKQQADIETSAVGFTPLSLSTAQTTPFSFQPSPATKVSSNPTTGGLFTFGAQQPTAPVVTSSIAKPNTTPMFSFTGSNQAVPSTNTPSSSGSGKNTPFSFTPTNTAATLPDATTTGPVLAKTNSVPPFNFTGSVGTSSSAKTTSNHNSPSLFSFTGSTSTDQAKTAPVFSFGAVNGPTSSNGANGQTRAGLFSFTGSQQQSTAPVVENQNSMGGEEMDADSNNNHDQNTFPQAPGGFNFTAPMAGSASSIFSAGANATPGGTQGGFNFNANTGIATTFQFGSNTSTPSGGLNFGGGVQTAGASPFMFGGASTPSSGPPNSSTTHVPFNFSANPVPLKPQQNVGQSAEQPALFSMGASQTTPSSNNRVYKKALRRSRHK